MTAILRNRANFKANVVGHVSRVISVSLKFLSLKYCCNNEQIGPNTLSYMKPCHDVELLSESGASTIDLVRVVGLETDHVSASRSYSGNVLGAHGEIAPGVLVCLYYRRRRKLNFVDLDCSLQILKSLGKCIIMFHSIGSIGT